MQIHLNEILLRSCKTSVFVPCFISGIQHIFHLIAKVIEKNVQPILHVSVPFRVFLM